MYKRFLANWRHVLLLAWPLIIANGFWNLQTTVDRVFLGHLSTDALGASMAAIGIFWAPMALVQGTASYVTTFIAQYLGAKRPDRVGASVWQALYLSIFGGLLFLLFIPISDWMFQVIDHPANTQALESEYFKAVCLSALPFSLIAVSSGFFTGIGKTSTVLWINGTGLVINVILDYLLIFGNGGFPALGIAGAGYATALSNAGAAAVGFFLMFNSHYEKKYQVLSQFKPQWSLIQRMLKYGLPSGLQWALEGLAFTAFLILIGRFENGDIALAASSITVTIMMLAILPPLGVAQAISVLVGQGLGALQPRRAERYTWAGFQISLSYIVVLSLSFFFAPEFFMNWFKSGAESENWLAVSEMVPTLLIFVSAFILFDSSNLIFSFALKGAGDTRFVSLIALTLPWPLMVIPTWWVIDWNNGVYWAWGATSVFIALQAVVFLMRFQSGKWKLMKVIESEPAPLGMIPPN